MKDENKRRIIQMKGIWTTQKNASWVGQVGVEEWMVKAIEELKKNQKEMMTPMM